MNKYLIIYAHPDAKSFNHAVKKQIEIKLAQGGSIVNIRDLYRMKFDSVLSGKDMSLLKRGKVTYDVKKEQSLVKDSDTLIFIYPVWWFGMPAVLKGYFDRVFSLGFAFDLTQKGPRGLLSGKRVVIFNTTGMSKRDFSGMNYAKALKKTIDTGIFESCGMKVVLHKYFFQVTSVTRQIREKMLEDLNKLRL